ncbi:MAG TPA: hypothetical protein VD927_16510 [Chryseosolibacter sp.]|nr:hypothetical protein [Chryseosolibacter sp.]
MKTLLERLLSGNREKETRDFSADFIRNRKGILKALEASKENGSVVGVYSRAFGDGMFLVAVESIDNSGKEAVICFHRYDMSGHVLSRNELDISDIKMILPFRNILKSNVLTSTGTSLAAT